MIMEPVQEHYSGDAASHPVIEVRGVRHEFVTRHDATPRVALETTNMSVERNSFVS